VIDPCSSEDKAFVDQCLRTYFARLPVQLRTGVAKPPGGHTDSWPLTVPPDLWETGPDAQGLVSWRPFLKEPIHSESCPFLSPASFPPLYQSYLLRYRVCRLELWHEDLSFVLPPTPTHNPAIVQNLVQMDWPALRNSTRYEPVATSVDGRWLICFDRAAPYADGDGPVVALPLDLPFRMHLHCERGPLAAAARLLTPSFRALLARCCLTETPPWTGAESCPFTRHPAAEAGLAPFAWEPWLTPAAPGAADDPPQGITPEGADALDGHLRRIARKVDALRRADPACLLAGATYHRYQMHPRLLEAERRDFEAQEGCLLPEVYAALLTTLGNGGCGPGDGFIRLECSRARSIGGIACWSGVDEGRLTRPFPLRGPWNLEEFPEGLLTGEADRDYYDARRACGTVLLACVRAKRGPERSVLLVVSGPERGHVWVDDRMRGHGLYPLCQGGPYSLLAWYERGLDRLLAEVDWLYAPGRTLDPGDLTDLVSRAYGLADSDIPAVCTAWQRSRPVVVEDWEE
jgi:hypothetical protein